MPLVYRKIQHKTPGINAERTATVKQYVRPDRLTPADKRNIVPLEKIPDAQLQDLAHRFPKEYGKALEERGVPPWGAEADDYAEDAYDDDEEEELDALTPDQQRFQTMKATDAIAHAQQTSDAATLVRYELAEREREGGPRKSVLAAISDRIEALEAERADTE